MSRKSNKKKMNQGNVRPKMPVEKPDASHMPICAAPGCKRKVSDARKSRCGYCSTSSSSAADYAWEMYDY